MKTLPIVVASVAVLVAGCGAVPADPSAHPLRPSTASTATAPTAPTSTLPAGDPSFPIPAPGTCHLGSEGGNPMPDSRCAGGAINPDVSQANIRDTICKSGWTATVRPPVSVTNRIKKQIDAAYSLPTTTVGELDHKIPLEIGGAPNDARNFWVEPGSIPNVKDGVESKLNKAVCAGRITLSEAQRRIATDWTTATNGL